MHCHGLITNATTATRIIAYTRLLLRGLCIFVFVLTLGLSLDAQARNQSQQADQARKELQSLRDKIDQVRNKIEHGKGDHKKLNQQLANANRAISQEQKQLDSIEHKIGTLSEKVHALKEKYNHEQDNLKDDLNNLRAQIRAAYRQGQTDKLRVLLSGQDPSRIGRTLAYYEYFAKAQIQQISQLRDTLDVLAKQKRELDEQQQKLNKQHHARAQSLNKLKHSRANRKQALAELEKRQSQRKASLSDYQKDAQELEDTITALQNRIKQKAVVSENDFQALKGQLPNPIQGRLIAHFGDKKAHGKMRWSGQWRAAKAGTPVKAVATGRVVYVGYMHHYGLIVVLQHAKTFFTVYGHNQTSTVYEGDVVYQGETIARAGYSGGHKQSGSYFEIRHGNQPLNPSRWLK